MTVPHAASGETFVSVDVETTGPSPSGHSLISMGACLVEEPDRGFYVEMKPVNDGVDEGALAVSGLSIKQLKATGVEAGQAMRQFADWLDQEIPAGQLPVFVGFNASFDWMFVDDYFQRYLGANPFGHSALDIKSYAMGANASTWAETSMRVLAPRYLGGRGLSHNALSDARDQAQLFRAIRAEARHAR